MVCYPWSVVFSFLLVSCLASWLLLFCVVLVWCSPPTRFSFIYSVVFYPYRAFYSRVVDFVLYFVLRVCFVCCCFLVVVFVAPLLLFLFLLFCFCCVVSDVFVLFLMFLLLPFEYYSNIYELILY